MDLKINKVIFFSHTSNVGGAEKSLFELVVGLKKGFGIEPLVIFPDFKGNMPQMYKKEDINFLNVALPWMKVSDTSSAKPQKALIKSTAAKTLGELETIMARFKPGMCFTQTSTHSWGAISAAMNQIPHFWNVREYGAADHELFEVDENYVCKNEIISLSDQIYTSSNHLGIEIFGNSSLWKPLYSVPSQNLTKSFKSARNPQSKLRIIFAGSFTKSKNPLLLIEAANLLRVSGVLFEIDFYGIGDKEIEMFNLIETYDLHNFVTIKGHSSNLQSQYCEYDVVVSCAPVEAFGRSLSEGAVYGCIPVYPDIDSWKERFSHELNGLSYVPQDARDLSFQLSKLSDLGYRRKLSSGILELVENNFNIKPPEEIVFQDLNNLLNKDFKEKSINSAILKDLIQAN
jgi:glycosyltransferase involved in cell wall biosynthesis